jgi:hypothetical protein
MPRPWHPLLRVYNHPDNECSYVRDGQKEGTKTGVAPHFVVLTQYYWDKHIEKDSRTRDRQTDSMGAMRHVYVVTTGISRLTYHCKGISTDGRILRADGKRTRYDAEIDLIWLTAASSGVTLRTQ